ncbi:MAG: YbjN domain-containing protein [Muribaculaceae bacterium]|nr:YbjN domain-containing protein [Muribaculaceae bacterium]
MNNKDGLIAATIRGFLDSHEYKYDFEEEKSCFSLGFTLDNDRVKVRIVYNEEKEWFSVFVYPSHAIPVKQIPKILSVLNQVNYEVLFGAIYCDPEDGELAVRCSASVDDRSVNETMVGVMLSTALNIADDYIGKIMKAMYAE